MDQIQIARPPCGTGAPMHLEWAERTRVLARGAVVVTSGAWRARIPIPRVPRCMKAPNDCGVERNCQRQSVVGLGVRGTGCVTAVKQVAKAAARAAPAALTGPLRHLWRRSLRHGSHALQVVDRLAVDAWRQVQAPTHAQDRARGSQMDAGGDVTEGGHSKVRLTLQAAGIVIAARCIL